MSSFYKMFILKNYQLLGIVGERKWVEYWGENSLGLVKCQFQESITQIKSNENSKKLD